jgi:hypothetical protein
LKLENEPRQADFGAITMSSWRGNLWRRRSSYQRAVISAGNRNDTDPALRDRDACSSTVLSFYTREGYLALHFAACLITWRALLQGLNPSGLLLFAIFGANVAQW